MRNCETMMAIPSSTHGRGEPVSQVDPRETCDTKRVTHRCTYRETIEISNK
ncbi:hypothetical protein Hanom_Chr03g00251851 [Helianthus anomalus]